jgi:uncharacterized protein
MAVERKYLFDWNLLGDLDLGRPNLGKTTRLEVYRLMQFTFRDALEERFGTEVADEIFYSAGHMAGISFYQNALGQVSGFDAFIQKLQQTLIDLSIGILRVEKADHGKGSYILTVSEDLDCSGLPESDTEICVYDEGFIAGLLESFSGQTFNVKEVDCWCTGDRTCRFTADVIR